MAGGQGRLAFAAAVCVALVVLVALLQRREAVHTKALAATALRERVRQLDDKLHNLELTARGLTQENDAFYTQQTLRLGRIQSKVLELASASLQQGGGGAAAGAAGGAGGLSRFRLDGRCGASFPAPGAPAFGECNPSGNGDQQGPCCNPDSGWCGNVRGVSWGHCDCATCIDYSWQHAARPPPPPPPPPPSVLQQFFEQDPPPPPPPSPPPPPPPPPAVAGAKTKVRPDGRCGPKYPAPGSPQFGQCDPLADADQKGPCCNPSSGWCGNMRGASWGHCDCPECVDFSAANAVSRMAIAQQARAVEMPPGKGDVVPSSDCGRAFSVDAGGWPDVLIVCRQLFSSVDLSLGTASTMVCQRNPTTQSSLCRGRNVALDPAAAVVGLDLPGALTASCLHGASVEEVTSKLSGPGALLAKSLSQQSTKPKLEAVCSKWVDRAVIMQSASSAVKDVFALYQALRLAEWIKGDEAIPQATLLILPGQEVAKDFKAPFSSQADLSGLSGTTCFSDLLVVSDPGPRSPLVQQYACEGDSIGIAVCDSFSTFLQAHVPGISHECS